MVASAGLNPNHQRMALLQAANRWKALADEDEAWTELRLRQLKQETAYDECRHTIR